MTPEKIAAEVKAGAIVTIMFAGQPDENAVLHVRFDPDEYVPPQDVAPADVRAAAELPGFKLAPRRDGARDLFLTYQK